MEWTNSFYLGMYEVVVESWDELCGFAADGDRKKTEKQSFVSLNESNTTVS
jgi:hypothetical protein